MKLLDRYILSAFIKNYFISFFVLVGMYIVLDMVFNFDELTEVQRGAGAQASLTTFELILRIVDYYSHQLLLFFVQLSGIIPVVAAAFTLMRFSRFNELVAMLAAGVSLLRIAAPIILAAVVLNFVLLPIVQELIIPNMIPSLIREHDEVRSESGPEFPIQAMQDEQGSLLLAGRYRPGDGTRPAVMEEVDIIQRDAELQPSAHVIADAAEWDAQGKRWLLTNGRKVTGLRANERRSAPERVDFYQSNISPDEIVLYRSGNYVELLSTERINQLLQRPKSYGMIDLLRVKHTRFTQIFNNVILLLLAIPAVLTREPGKLRAAAMKCFILVGACMAVIFITQNLAGNPQKPEWADIWPATLAWLPIVLFAPLAIFLLDRVKTKAS